MGYPAVGSPIAGSDINAALLRPPAQQISYNDTEVRNSTGQTSGSVSAYNMGGKFTGTVRVTSAYNAAGLAYGWSGGTNGAGGYGPNFGGVPIDECYWIANRIIISFIGNPPNGAGIIIRDANFVDILNVTSGVTYNWEPSKGKYIAQFQTTTNWFPVGSVRWVVSN